MAWILAENVPPSAVPMENVLPEALKVETPATFTLAALVILPNVSTVNTGTLAAPPYVLAVTPDAPTAVVPLILNTLPEARSTS